MNMGPGPVQTLCPKSVPEYRVYNPVTDSENRGLGGKQMKLHWFEKLKHAIIHYFLPSQIVKLSRLSN